MSKVQGHFPDYTKHNNQGSFSVESDKAFNPYTWQPPINWSGFVNGTKVSFVQISASGSHISNYDFSGFPPELDAAKGYIIEAIDKAMRVMD